MGSKAADLAQKPRRERRGKKEKGGPRYRPPGPHQLQPNTSTRHPGAGHGVGVGDKRQAKGDSEDDQSVLLYPQDTLQIAHATAVQPAPSCWRFQARRGTRFRDSREPRLASYR